MQSSDDTTETPDTSELTGSGDAADRLVSTPEIGNDGTTIDARTADKTAADLGGHVIADDDTAPASDDPTDRNDADEVDIALGQIRLDDSWREEPRRPVIERFRPAIGLTAAIMLHVAVAAAGYASFAGISERIGGGGADETSISVELITREALDAVRANRQTRPPELRRAANAATVAPVQGTDTAQVAVEDMQDSAPPQVTDAPKPPAPKTAPVIAAPAEPTERGSLVVAERRGPTRPADETPDTQPEDVDETATAATMAPTTPTQSEVASQSQDAQAATAKGGETSRSLVVASVPPTEPSAVEAARASGRAARGYAAELVKALVRLEDHLQSRTNSAGRRERGRVELLLRLGRDGGIETLRVARSSGRQSLDQQALRDVASFSFPTPPPQLSNTQRTFKLPITYR